MNKRTALYCRTSTNDPAELAHQRTALQQYAQEHGFENPVLYEDIGLTVLQRRPEFMRLERDVRNGKVTRVLTTSVSRIERNTPVVMRWIITIAFDPGTWRDIFADDPFNIPAVMVLKDGSEIEMTFQGGGGISLAKPDPTDPTKCYNTLNYSYDLLDTNAIDRIEFDRYVFLFADGDKVALK